MHFPLANDATLAVGTIASGAALFFSLRTGKTIPTPMVFYAEDNPVLYWSVQSIAFGIFASCLLGLAENAGWL